MQAFSKRLKQLAIEQKNYYADLSSMFAKDFRTNDVGIVTNASAVQQSIASIIGTRKGERVFDPNFGCDIHGSLFDNMNDASALAIERAISDAVRNYEPRVSLEEVRAEAVYDENMYMVSLYYRLITDLNYIYQLQMELKDG